MRPSKAKKESLAMAMAIDRDADAEYTSESEADLTQRSYAAVVARPGTPQTAEGRPPPPGPPPSGPPPAGSRSPSPRQGGSVTGESSKKRKDQKDKVNTLQEREAQRVLAAHRQQLRTSEPEGPASALQGAERGVATRPLGPAPPVVATGSGAPREPTASRQEMQKFQGLKACLRKPCPWKTDCRNLHVSFDELTRCLATQPSGTPTAPRWRAPTTQRREASPPRRPTTPERRRRTSHSPRPARESPRRRARGTRSRTRSSSEELRAARVVLEKMMWKRRKK
eukprot:GFUD01106192.1.p1 GENE.GFUD01106192.1~~GFUD01106192.1.p1  ORF type:complete len:297 (-),score=51.34 GFUD01106192.1:74-919(-)